MIPGTCMAKGYKRVAQQNVMANTNPSFPQPFATSVAADKSRHPKWFSRLKFCRAARNPDILQARITESLQLAARARVLPPH
jgi:hypothetical protein